jgi:exodeoxyribonuclease VII large subunit
MTQRVVPVGLLTTYIRDLFESDRLLQDVWIEGEVSEAFAAKSGHIYFTLRDERTQLKCVLFKREAARQLQLPRVGDQLTVHARVSVYEATGQYQAYVDVVQPAGLGIQALLMEQLRQKLDAEGLFDVSRKRPVPAAPKCIAVVTSTDGAVLHDIQTVLQRRYPLTHLLVAAAAVQGDRAPVSLIEAIRRVQDDGRAEVLIVARGGGSADDLACFNDEGLARAVFACRIPVVSAVGHETDWTIIDLVADLRAATPSAAAELCSPDGSALLERIGANQRVLVACLASSVRARREEMRPIRQTLTPSSARALLAGWRTHLDEANRTLAAEGIAEVAMRRISVRDRVARVRLLCSGEINGGRTGLQRCETAVNALSPARVMSRGYAFVHRQGDDRAVTSASQLQIGDRLESVFSDGAAISRVDGIASGAPWRRSHA